MMPLFPSTLRVAAAEYGNGKVVAAVVVAATLLSVGGCCCWALPRYSERKWRRRVDDFIRRVEDDGGDAKDDDDDAILFVVNPASGGGRSMAVYGECRDAFEETGYRVQVVVTRSYRDMISLLETKIGFDRIRRYKAIAVLGGDSTVAEVVQSVLRRNGGIWPRDYPPVLHLPGGTGNAIAGELFGYRTSPRDIIRTGLSKSERSSVIKVSYSSSSGTPKKSVAETTTTTRYAIHNAFDGVQRYMLVCLDRHRHDWYALFGEISIMPMILGSILIGYNRPPKQDFPYFGAYLTDFEGLGMELGFGLARRDPYMMVIRIEEGWPGSFRFLRDVLFQFMSGRLAEQWRAGQLPDYLRITKTRKYVIRGSEFGGAERRFNFYFDGGGTMSFKGTLDSESSIEIEVVPDAISYCVPNA